MIKQLLLGATLATAALASTQLLADPTDHRHGQNAQCSGANCPAASATEGHGHHGMGRGMHAARGEGHGSHGTHAAHGAKRGQGGEGCPMHSEPKSG